MASMIVGVLAAVIFSLTLSAGSVESSDRAMLISADVEPQVAAAPPPPEDADGDGVSDLDPLAHQTQVQQQQIQEQQDQTNAILEEVNALRGALIEKRFERLDRLAKRRGWHRNRRIPKEGRRYWDEYQEWKYLKENLEEVKKPKLEKPKKAPSSVAAKPMKASKKQYKPDWLME